MEGNSNHLWGNYLDSYRGKDDSIHVQHHSKLKKCKWKQWDIYKWTKIDNDVEKEVVGPSYLQVPHSWIQPTTDQKYSEKNWICTDFFPLFPKQYRITPF